MADTNYSQIHDKILAAIKRRGVDGIRDLSRTFKIYDDSGNKKLSKAEFKKGIQDYGLRLTQGVLSQFTLFIWFIDTNTNSQELDMVFSYFDKNTDGEIDFEEFLSTLRVIY